MSQMDHARMRQWLAVEGEALLPLADEFVSMGLTLEEAKVFLDAARRKRSSWFVKLVDKRMVEELDDKIEGAGGFHRAMKGSANSVHVNLSLTEEEKGDLRSMFSCVVDLNFAHARRALPTSHGKSHAARCIARTLIFRNITATTRVLEVGARLEHVVKSAAVPGLYLGCSPVLDIFDVERQSGGEAYLRAMKRLADVGKLRPDQARTVRVLDTSRSALMVSTKVQEVDWQCDVVVGVDTNYNIPMEDMPRTMARTGASVWYGSLLRAEGVLDESTDEGVVRGLGMMWEADRSRDHISFFFDKPSKPYEHRLSVYLEYLKYPRREFVYGGEVYYYTMLQSTVQGQLMFAMYRVGKVEPSLPSVMHVPSSRHGYLRVKTVEKVNGKLRPLEYWVTEEQLSLVLQKRMTMKRVEDDGAVYRVVRNSNLGYIIGGVRVSVADPMAHRFVHPTVVLVKELASQMFRRGDEEVKGLRDNLATEGKVYASVGSWVRGAVSGFFFPERFIVEGVVNGVADALGASKYQVEVFREPAFVELQGVVVDLGGPPPPSPTFVCACQKAAALTLGVVGRQDSETVKAVAAVMRRKPCCRHMPMGSELWEDTDISSDTSEADSVQGSGGTVESGLGTEATSMCGDDVGDTSEEVVGTREGGGVLVDSVVEFIDWKRAQRASIESTARLFCRHVLFRGTKFNDGDLAVLSNGKVSHFVLLVMRGDVVGMVGPQSECVRTSFSRAYDWQRDTFVDVRVSRGKAVVPAECSNVLYTNTDMVVWLYDQHIGAAERTLRSWVLPPVKPGDKPFAFLKGLAGAGKTYSIERAACEEGDLYVTSTANNKESTGATFRKQGWTSEQVWRNCRTMDSVLAHDRAASVRRVFIDEQPMSHGTGAIMLKNAFPKAEVYLVGDYDQVTAKPFCGGFKFKHSSLQSLCKEVVLRTQHRYPMTVAAGALRIYGADSGLACCKCHERTWVDDPSAFRYLRVASVADIPVIPGAKYVALGHVEVGLVREYLAGLGIVDAVPNKSDKSPRQVHTAAEVQGESYDEVVLVRLNSTKRPDSLYHSKEHVLVAITRVFKRLWYVTASDERDLVVECWEWSQDPTKVEIVRNNSINMGKETVKFQDGEISVEVTHC